MSYTDERTQLQSTNKMKLLVLARALSIIFCSSIITTAAEAKNDKNEKAQGKPAKEVPYGLQKKASRGAPLPPGWQKKLQRGDRLSDELYSRGRINSPIDNDGNIVIDIDETPIKINSKTREIIDILINEH